MRCLLFFLAVGLQSCAADSFPIRLSGGPNLCTGRVEVFRQGKWGTVCDDEWDVRDAAVVCRELKCGEALSAPHNAWFGEGTGPIWLNEVHCTGTERHLHACRHKGFREHLCHHEEDASAFCSAQRFAPLSDFSPLPTVTEVAETTASSTPIEGTLRLIGGRSRCSGRLEVFYQGRWGTVCDDMWGLPEVTVVCRELGCGEALAAPGGALFGEGNDAIWLDDVRCQGEESSLTKCLARPWGKHNCRHSEDAGAVCSDEMSLTMWEKHWAMLTMTLAPQTSQPMETATYLTQPTESVVYEASQHAEKSSAEESAEAMLARVLYRASQHAEKSSAEESAEAMLAGQWEIRLAGGSGSCTGRVEILFNNSWGTVCDDGWDLLDAAVVCRELGCGAPLHSPGNARYGPGSGPIWLDDVSCTGIESTLLHCQSQPWGQHNCNHNEDASVDCAERWKPLPLPESRGDSSAAKQISTTQDPTPSTELELQYTLDMVEDSLQGLSPVWEIEFHSRKHFDEVLLTPTREMELERKEEPRSSWSIDETNLGQQVLQDHEITVLQEDHEIEPTSPQRTRSPTHKGGLEPTHPSTKSQLPSAMWDLELEREMKPTKSPETVTLKQLYKASVETVPSIQWDNISRELLDTQNAEPSKSSVETQSTSAVRVAESAGETEPASFAGTEQLSITQGLKTAKEMVTQVHWDDMPGGPPVTQGPTDPSAETQPDSAMWVWESEGKTKPTIDGGKKLFLSSESVESTRETEMPTDTRNIQPMKDREDTGPKITTPKEDGEPKQKEGMDKDPRTLRPVDTASMPGLTKALGTSMPSAEPDVHTAQLSEPSPGCPVRQEPSKEDQSCGCSLPTLGKIVHSMDSLQGGLGSLSTAIQQQGAQLEAVAFSLAELATSVRQLVGVLPALMQPVPTQPSSAACIQDEDEVQNRLPLQ